MLSNYKYLFSYKFSAGLLLVVLSLLSATLNESSWLFLLLAISLTLIPYPIYILPVYLITSLSTTYFAAGDGIGISRLIGFVLILSIIVHIAKRERRFVFSKNMQLLTLLLFYALISSLFSLTGSFKSFITFAQIVIVYLLIDNIRNISKNDLYILTILIVVSSIIVISFISFNLQENLIKIKVDRLSSSDDLNANRFAMMIAQIGAVCYAAFLIFKTNKSFQVLLIAFLILSAYLIILSGSRSALIGLLGGVIVASMFLSVKNFTKYWFPILFFTAISIFFTLEILKLDIPFIDRFTLYNIQKTGGTNRYAIWTKLIPLTIENNFFFGYGFGGENSYQLAKQYGLWQEAHNFLIDMFIQIGFIGVILFLTFFYKILSNAKLISVDYYLVLPFLMVVTAMVNGIGETIYLEKLFWNGLMLISLYVNIIKNNPVVKLENN